MPRFSIIVPAYEAAATLAETLDAVLAQTFADWECIVVDDGSTDDTAHIADAYASADDRIKVLHQANTGTAGAYNAGVSSACGDFVVICSADDILLPEHLSSVSAFIDAEAGYDIYSTNGYIWYPGESQDLFYPPGDGSGKGPLEPADAICSLDLADVIHRCFYSVGAAYRRDLFAAVRGYRLGVYGEDYDFWLRAMASRGRHRYLPEPLSLHRIGASQKSANLEIVFRSDIRLISDLRREFPLSSAESAAVAERIAELDRLIAMYRQPWRSLRRAVRQQVTRVIGPRQTRRLSRALKSRIGPRKSSIEPGP
jgi:glycosyltransferase involved in cell wall biosynthesis